MLATGFAFVAAETLEIAEAALQLIEVDYEVLQPMIDPTKAMEPGAPVIHDEPDYVNFDKSNPARNLAAEIRIDIGDIEKGFSEADRIFEEEYVDSKVQQAHIEPHVVVTYWDEDDRLVIRTSTQVPFHVRRQIARFWICPSSASGSSNPGLAADSVGNRKSWLKMWQRT